MPQLDFVTYLSQYFWLCVFFLALYFGATKWWLPRLSRVLALRRAKSSSSTGEHTGASGEHQKLSQATSAVVSRAGQETRRALDQGLTRGRAWTSQQTRTTLERYYSPADQALVHQLASRLVSGEVTRFHAASPVPAPLSLLQLLQRLSRGAKI